MKMQALPEQCLGVLTSSSRFLDHQETTYLSKSMKGTISVSSTNGTTKRRNVQLEKSIGLSKVASEMPLSKHYQEKKATNSL